MNKILNTLQVLGLLVVLVMAGFTLAWMVKVCLQTRRASQELQEKCTFRWNEGRGHTGQFCGPTR